MPLPADPICLSRSGIRVRSSAMKNRECNRVSPAGNFKPFAIVGSDTQPVVRPESEAVATTSGAEPSVESLFEDFNRACDQMDVAAAQALLLEVKAAMSRNGQPSFKDQGDAGQNLVDAHFRLWELRHLVR